jgi:hypothetical protein
VEVRAADSARPDGDLDIFGSTDGGLGDLAEFDAARAFCDFSNGFQDENLLPRRTQRVDQSLHVAAFVLLDTNGTIQSGSDFEG